MLLYTSSAVLALAATSFVQAYDPYLPEYTDLRAREADHDARQVRALLAREALESSITDALVARDVYGNLDDLYAPDLWTRDLQIDNDFLAVSTIRARDEGLRARDLEASDAIYRLSQLARRDPELYHFYARKNWKTGAAIGAAVGTVVAPGVGTLAGAAIGGGIQKWRAKRKEKKDTGGSSRGSREGDAAADSGGPSVGLPGAPEPRSVHGDPDIHFE